ncbi:MAG TPA: ribosomal protein S18-alanine N-acetyltransferase [Anaerolineaceae bacterium]|nr:ribosomal protein S18-alanine N-acetyltransferase [Anaerolineaceae bacterium]
MSPHVDASHIRLRSMHSDDISQVAALDQLSFADPWPQGSFEYELKANNYSLCLVAEDPDAAEGQTIVGALVIWLIVDEAHIATIAVHPNYRHRGVGRRLLAEGLLQAADRGAVKSLLEVRSGNTEALHLYYGFGFKAVGLRPNYYQAEQEDALLLDLDPLDMECLRNLKQVYSS